MNAVQTTLQRGRLPIAAGPLVEVLERERLAMAVPNTLRKPDLLDRDTTR